MSTVIQIEPELGNQAEAILNRLGTSISEVTNMVLRYVVARKKLPEDLSRPPIPCFDDMTEEEFDAMIEESFDAIEAGRCLTIEEVKKQLREEYSLEV